MALRTNPERAASRLSECPLCLDTLSESGECPVCGFQRTPTEYPNRSPQHNPPVIKNLSNSTESVMLQRNPSANVSFIGRDAELNQLIDFIGSASPHPKLVRITGPVGIGKKRIVAEALARMQQPPHAITWTCEQYGALISYGPIQRWLASFPEMSDGRAHEEDCAIESFAPKVAGLPADDLFELRLLMGKPVKRASSNLLPPDHIRRNLHRVLGRLISGLANEDGICLVVVHSEWLDSASASFVDDLVRGIISNPLTVIFISSGDTATGYLPSQSPHLALELGPLPQSDCGKLFDAIVPGIEFLPELHQFVIQRKIGTPLFLAELARLVHQINLVNSGPLQPKPSANIVDVLPQSLPELIERRIELLDQRTQMLMQVAAVLGPDCSLGLCECFDQISDDLKDQLRLLEGVELLRRQEGTRDPRFYFVEEHVRDLAYQSMPREQRKAIHHKIARVMESAYASEIVEHFESLAWHFKCAEDMQKTAYYRIKAADRQYSLGAVDSALESYGEAFELLSGLNPTPENEARMARVLLFQGRILRYQGRHETALSVLDGAVRIGHELENRYLTDYARLETALTYLDQGKTADAKIALSGLRDEFNQQGRKTAECVTLSGLGVIHLQAGEYIAALGCFHELMVKASAPGQMHMRADALNNMGLIFWRWSRYADAAKAFRESATIRSSMADQFGLIASVMNLGILQEQMCEIKPALMNFSKALLLAQQTGFVRGQALLHINLSNIRRRIGQYIESADHAACAVQLARELGDRGAEWAALDNLGLACAELGRCDEAARHIRDAIEIVNECGSDEVQTQVYLDLADILIRTGAALDIDTTELENVLKKIECRGWRELLPQACRLIGRRVYLANSGNSDQAKMYLLRSLDCAVQSKNVFEQLATLRELVACGPDAGHEVELAEWHGQAERIERMIQACSPAEQVS